MKFTASAAAAHDECQRPFASVWSTPHNLHLQWRTDSVESANTVAIAAETMYRIGVEHGRKALQQELRELIGALAVPTGH